MATLIFNHAQGHLFGGLLLSDPAAIFWKMILLLFVAGVIVLWFSDISAPCEGDGPEFFCSPLIGATLGMCFMASTSNRLMLILSMELTSLPSYVLAGFRKTIRLGAEASLKYVLFGAASECGDGVWVVAALRAEREFAVRSSGDGGALAAAGDCAGGIARGDRGQNRGRAVSLLVPGCF